MKITLMKQERLKRKWTLEDVAKKAGTTKQSIQRIETLQRKPSYDILVKLENIFNLQHHQLFALTDDEPNSQKNNNIKS